MTSHDVESYVAWLKEFAAPPQNLGDDGFKFQVYESRGHYQPFQGLNTPGVLAWHRA